MHRFSFSGRFPNCSTCGFRIKCPPVSTTAKTLSVLARATESLGCTPDMEIFPIILTAWVTISLEENGIPGTQLASNNLRAHLLWDPSSISGIDLWHERHRPIYFTSSPSGYMLVVPMQSLQQHRSNSKTFSGSIFKVLIVRSRNHPSGINPRKYGNIFSLSKGSL